MWARRAAESLRGACIDQVRVEADDVDLWSDVLRWRDAALLLQVTSSVQSQETKDHDEGSNDYTLPEREGGEREESIPCWFQIQKVCYLA